MKNKLLFVCREGFAYVAWQRVEVWLVTVGSNPKIDTYVDVERQRWNVSHTVADKFNFKQSSESLEEGRLIKGEGCLFVLSGESFTLHDFADAIATELDMEYSIEDGDE